MMHTKAVATIMAVIAAFILVSILMASLLRDAKLRNLLNESARQTLLGQKVIATDLWDKPIHCMVESSAEATVATAVSGGPDLQIGTPDDISAEAIDYNVTYNVGKWTGTHSKELVKGVFKGIMGDDETKTLESE